MISVKELVKNEVKTCRDLVKEYIGVPQPEAPEKIQFSGVEGRDVYNITAPFKDGEEYVIAGRVEERDSEHSEVYFFVNRGGEWVPRKGDPVFKLQDPFFTRIRGELVLGGVEIFPHPEIESALGWRTVFYKGKTISKLKKLTVGPDGMKDLRLVELMDGSVGIMTRPQGEKGGRGEIGFVKVPSLEDVSIEVINDAPLLEGQFIKEEWGGANEIHLLSNGLLGVLGHIACFDEEENRHYYPMVFALNPDTGDFSDIRIIARRSDFLEGDAKRPDLADVVFSGGIVRNENGTADLYAGISDAEAQRITVPDPFLTFEK
ncbi:DUF1861 family protein [Alteribacter keqinensis]|uniref:DUF1861 family protein n=1 Tax=Alteribacter keqinensis TaxID=2483800 RepID=A0A3M7TQK8_9BACI|nr:DUF1861 family protein [Alteribacter keqinensis]